MSFAGSGIGGTMLVAVIRSSPPVADVPVVVRNNGSFSWGGLYRVGTTHAGCVGTFHREPLAKGCSHDPPRSRQAVLVGRRVDGLFVVIERNEMTICLKCKHVRKAELWTRRWTQLGCGQYPIEMCQNPVTGDMEPATDGVTVKHKGYTYCDRVNKGECPDYETK